MYLLFAVERPLVFGRLYMDEAMIITKIRIKTPLPVLNPFLKSLSAVQTSYSQDLSLLIDQRLVCR